jgi:hypothetical protein
MKNKKYHTVGTIPKSNTKMVKGTIDTLTHKYMAAHFPGLAQTLQYKVAGLNYIFGPNFSSWK